jgi:hypothetical protein
MKIPKHTLKITIGSILIILIVVTPFYLLWNKMFDRPSSVKREIGNLTLSYLEHKYNQEFVIKHVEFNAPNENNLYDYLVDKPMDTYSIEVRLKNSTKYEDTVIYDTGTQTFTDKIYEILWTIDATRFVTPIINSEIPESPYFTLSAYNGFLDRNENANHTYQDMLKKHPEKLIQDLFIIRSRPINNGDIHRESEKIFNVINNLENRGISLNAVILDYYDSKIPRDVWENLTNYDVGEKYQKNLRFEVYIYKDNFSSPSNIEKLYTNKIGRK